MAHLQYMPGDPRLVDQLVYELKSKGIFDQFRKECIADVDTRPAYQNLRQRVESSVAMFLSRQTWKPDLNKNQLREKLRKHILDGNYLEQGVERIVDQVVNPKVASVFIPQVEDLVYNYLGIPRKKKAETAEKTEDLLPTDLEAVSPGSVKSNDEESKESESKVQDMEIDSEDKTETTEDMILDTQKGDVVEVSSDSTSMDKSSIPLPTEEIKLESIPAPQNSPKPAKVELESIELPSEPDKPSKVELKNIELPKEPNLSTDIPLPDEISESKKYSSLEIFKPIPLHSEDSNSSSGSSIRRNMSPLTPVRNFDDENSCDAQQAFDNNDTADYKEQNSFRFNIETKESNDSSDVKEKEEKKETELAYQFNNQVNINTYNTPMYDDSSNSHNLQIDYESDANTNTSKTTEVKQEVENSEDSKKERKDDKKSHKSSHKSRDSSRHSSSKDKYSSSRDSSRHDKKSSKDDKSKTSKERERSKDRSDKKDSSKHKSSHKSSSSSSKDKHRSSSSTHRHSSKSSDERKSSNSKSTEKDKERSSDKSSRDKRDSKSSSHRDKDRKSSKKDEKDKKKEKKDVDDHYSSSGRGNHSRRSTDRDSNDGSSSSKGSHSQNNSKSTTDRKKENKNGSSKSDNTSTSGETSQSDKEHIVANKVIQSKPIRVDNHLETPIANPPRLPFVPDVTLKKPKFANNFEEAKKMMKMRKFLAEEQKRMNQEAALLLEFQANVRPSLSQVYSSISGPELEFACITNDTKTSIKTDTEETMKVEFDVNTPETLYLESLELKHIAKGTADIINDIIGVPADCEQVSNHEIKLETQNINEKVEVNNESYDENKPFSQLVDEINQHGKVERSQDSLEESLAEIVHDNSTEFEITVASETLSETDVSEILEMNEPVKLPDELHYFTEQEKFSVELERHKFSEFLTKYIEQASSKAKMFLVNCDTYEENIVKEIANNFGDYEIVNYYKNGHLVPNKNIVKDVPLCAEISLPLESNDYDEKSPMFSPVKSECSFELSSDYDAKLDELVNKKSRQEVMEIILGGIIDEPSNMPTIDYYTEMSDTENLTIVEEIQSSDSLKRKIEDEMSNLSVLSPNKIRKISDSDQISSTTEEPEVSNNNKNPSARSKYLGRARRVGLPRPKRCNLPNSPSSDKSVENYTQNTPSPTPNGKLKPTPRSKVQRYDTSDLYKPKLHYLSRRNNVS